MCDYRRNIRFRGFTLVELLVVIAIIALLLSILMPSLKKARNQARGMVCASHLKTIGLASTMYAQANSDYFPPSHSQNDLKKDQYNGPRNYPASGYAYPWYFYLWPYHGSFDTYICPLFPKMAAYEAHGSGTWTCWYITYPGFKNFKYKDGTSVLRSGYGYNNFVGGWEFSAVPYKPKKTAEVSSRVGLFGDSWLRDPQYDQMMAAWGGRAFGATHILVNGMWMLVGDARHSDGAGVSFGDGHVEKVPRNKAVSLVAGRFEGTVWDIK